MRKRIKKYLSAICLTLCVALSSMTVFAGMIAYGSEEQGFMVGTTQLRKKTAAFDDSTLNTKYKTYSTAAMTRWNNTGVITFSRNKSSQNKIIVANLKDTSAVAITTTYSNTTTGRIERFGILYNTNYMESYSTERNKRVATHEFGHIMGLKDLYNSYNQDKMMYGYSNSTASKPTAADIKGAKYATRK